MLINIDVEKYAKTTHQTQIPLFSTAAKIMTASHKPVYSLRWSCVFA